MKTILIVLMLLPSCSFAQKRDYAGEYTMPPIDDKKVHLKVWDTIREAFTFTADSFKYSYAVMRPNGRVAVSVDYDEYGAWKIDKDTTLPAPGNTTFQRTYAILDDGRITGYFEPAATGSATLIFVRGKKIFTWARKTYGPLQKM